MTSSLKKYDSIGCCGIDCGLCPRYHAKGDSACPGCGGLNFKEKHPSCGFLTCCAIQKNFEVCSDCNEFPCKRFDAEKNGYDSFVTHQKVFFNLDFIKSNGIEPFIEQQKLRIEILNEFLNRYDEGRSKSYFCISCALLPLDELKEIAGKIAGFQQSNDVKVMNKQLRYFLSETAVNLGIELKLNKK